jgi:hypothetical protein
MECRLLAFQLVAGGRRILEKSTATISDNCGKQRGVW